MNDFSPSRRNAMSGRMHPHYPLATLYLGASYAARLADTQLVVNYIPSALGPGKGQANEVQGQLRPSL